MWIEYMLHLSDAQFSSFDQQKFQVIWIELSSN